VAVLKELGAILLGKATMNEFGAGTHGFNTHAGGAVVQVVLQHPASGTQQQQV
jgi:Asp-tRNA(Asn)/Glu-tRNA(Gln) amidotransferase A subunit family amidase